MTHQEHAHFIQVPFALGPSEYKSSQSSCSSEANLPVPGINFPFTRSFPMHLGNISISFVPGILIWRIVIIGLYLTQGSTRAITVCG